MKVLISVHTCLILSDSFWTVCSIKAKELFNQLRIMHTSPNSRSNQFDVNNIDHYICRVAISINWMRAFQSSTISILVTRQWSSVGDCCCFYLNFVRTLTQHIYWDCVFFYLPSYVWTRHLHLEPPARRLSLPPYPTWINPNYIGAPKSWFEPVTFVWTIHRCKEQVISGHPAN